MPKHSDRLISLMFIMGRRIRDGMKRAAVRGSCSWIHMEALRFTLEEGKPLMRDLALHFSVTPPAATLLVDELVEHGFLRRLLDPRDRRAIRLAVTAEGRQALERGYVARARVIKNMFSVLDGREEAELIRILEKIIHETK